MTFEKFGNEKNKTIFFIEGMATTAHSCFDKILPYLEDFYVIYCNLDGHYDGSASFKSIEDECCKIENYVNEELDGKLFALLGFSLGGTIAVEIMSRGKIKIEKTILDAAFCVKMGLLTGLYTKAMSWSVKRICSGKKIPDFMIEFAMGKGNARIVETFYKGTDSETVKNECRDAYRYEIKSSLSDYNGEVIFLRGENEVYPAKTFRLLKKYIPQIKEIIFDGMGHGQFMNEHPEKYAETVLNVLSKSISMC